MLNRSAVIEAQIDAIKTADSLAETPFAELFHEARTTSRDRATGVSAPLRVRDGRIEVGTVHYTQQGMHHHVRDAPWDTTIGLSVVPLMGIDRARSQLVRQLEDQYRREITREDHEERRQRAKEDYDGTIA